METVMEFPRKKRDNQRKLGLDKGLKDAMADYLRRRYRTNAAKMAARDFDLTLDQGRSAVAGNASIATIERILKTGGWTVALVILADVIGTSIANYFIELRATHDKDGERLREVGRDLWVVASPRSFNAADVDHEGPDRRRSLRG